MTLKQQLLLVSLLTLMLPWAGCQFISETESALRAGQQQMLAGTARAIADSLAKYPEEFPPGRDVDYLVGDQLYGHRLDTQPEIDGYFDDWMLDRNSLRNLRGVDGPTRFAIGLFDESLYLYVEVTDKKVVYAAPGTIAVDNGSRFADRIGLVNTSPPYLEETLVFAAEAPGPIITYIDTAYRFSPEPRVISFWQDGPSGYQLEARIPESLLGTHLGLVISNTSGALEPAVRSASFASRTPGAFVSTSPELNGIVGALAQPGMRLIVTDSTGWRIATVGELTVPVAEQSGVGSTWLRIAYDALVESGQQADLAEPDASGRERQGYIRQALDGRESVSWFRSAASGRAVVAVAQPINVGNETVGRIGDTPTVAGTYCTGKVAISATGVGEEIVASALATRIATRVEDGMSLYDATARTLGETATRNFDLALIAAAREEKGKISWAAGSTAPFFVWAAKTPKETLTFKEI